MFKKLFKYDFRSIKRVGMPLLLGVAGLTVLGVIAVLIFASAYRTSIYLPENADDAIVISNIISMFGSTMFLMLTITGLSFIVAGMQIFCYIDFYKNTVTDEAYLTFTLPVKAKDIIFSKTLSSFLWVIIHTVVMLLALSLIVLVGYVALGEEREIFMQEYQIFISMFGFDAFAGDIALSVVLSIIFGIVNEINSLLLVFTAMFFVSTVMRKHRVIGAIGAVIISNAIVGGLTGVVETIVGVVASVIGVLANNPFISGNITIFIMTLVVAGLTVGLFFILKHLMEKKLNIE